MSATRRLSRHLAAATALAALALAAACGEGTTVPLDVELLPRELLFRADAEGVADNGQPASCYIETYIELDARVDRGGSAVQYGSGGGDAFRSMPKDEDTSVQFWAHMYFPTLEFHLLDEDRIEVRSPESEAVTDSRFWREVCVLCGHRRDAQL